jgi:hypothetical protein
MLMGLLTKYAFVACAATLGASTYTQKTFDALLKDKPCKNEMVKVEAFANSSRHGSWLSKTIGSADSLSLKFDAASEEPSLQHLRRYVFDPRAYQKSTFRAYFLGSFKCGTGDIRPELKVHRLEEITISPIR